MRIVYGFDANEPERIQNRIGVLASHGYLSEFPLAYGPRTIKSIADIGIAKPATYELYRHANCFGCLKAGRQQWYITFCRRPDIFQEALEGEGEIGFSILKGEFLEELVPVCSKMRCMGIVPTEKITSQRFWADVNRILKEPPGLFTPCECAV